MGLSYCIVQYPHDPLVLFFSAQCSTTRLYYHLLHSLDWQWRGRLVICPLIALSALSLLVCLPHDSTCLRPSALLFSPVYERCGPPQPHCRLAATANCPSLAQLSTASPPLTLLPLSHSHATCPSPSVESPPLLPPPPLPLSPPTPPPPCTAPSMPSSPSHCSPAT